MDHGLAPNTYLMTGQTIIVGAVFVLSSCLLLIQYNNVQASQGQSKSVVGAICLLRKGLLKKILMGAFNHITFQKGLHQIFKRGPPWYVCVIIQKVSIIMTVLSFRSDPLSLVWLLYWPFYKVPMPLVLSISRYLLSVFKVPSISKVPSFIRLVILIA